MEKAQYVHRLGRTARAGKSGKGLIILGDYEAAFLNCLSDLPITEAPRPSAQVFAEAQEVIQSGLAAVNYGSKAQVILKPESCHVMNRRGCCQSSGVSFCKGQACFFKFPVYEFSCADASHACIGRRTGHGWASTRASASCASGTQLALCRLPTSTQPRLVRHPWIQLISTAPCCARSANTRFIDINQGSPHWCADSYDYYCKSICSGNLANAATFRRSCFLQDAPSPHQSRRGQLERWA